MNEQGQKLVAASAAIIIAEPAMQLAHFGGPGVIVGLAAGAVAYLVTEEVQQARQAAGGDDTPPAPAREQKPTAPRQHSLLYRLFNGKSTRGDDEEPMEELQPNQRKQPSVIVLSPDLVLKPSEIIAKSIFIVGQRRSGKTTLGALIAEQIGQYSIPMFIPDSEGDLISVYDLLPRGVIAAAPGSRWEDDEEINLWTVTPEDADVLGFQILYEGMQVIFDMNSFDDDDDAWRVVIGVIDGLFEFTKQYPGQPCPVEVFLDEAQKYLPQDISTSAIRDPEVRDQLLDAYRDVSGTGGKRGITPVILSQRFAETNNKIIAQSELRFILRQTQDNDLARCKKYVRAETAEAEDIASFKKGQGVFVGEDGTQLVTTFNQRQSDGSRSGTPGIEAVQRFAHRPLRLQQPERADRLTGRQELDDDDDEQPIQRPTARRQEPRSADGKQAKRERIIRQGAQLRLAGHSQAVCAEKLGLTAWTIRPYWAEIEAEVERLRDLESQAE